MIRKIRSKLSVKIFLLTACLLAGCCGLTCACILRLAPYVYRHDVSEIEFLVEELAMMLSNIPDEELVYVLGDMGEILEQQAEGEYVFRIFNDAGEEVSGTNPETVTGKALRDFADVDQSGKYTVLTGDGTKNYTLLATKNTEKESQVVGALKKALPVLYGVIFAVSVTAAFFYAQYVTRPIRRVSAVSRRMAELDFSGLCAVGRTDEIGVLSDSLNELSGRLSETLGQLREANEKLAADIDMERELERQRLAFFSAASHELKTPITIIKGQLEGMLYQVGRYRDRDCYLKQSLEVTGTLEKMVQELLMISRLDAPGYACEKACFSLDGLLDERLDMSEELFVQRELVLEREIARGIDLSGDRRLMEKVFDSLLSNAALYSPAGNRVYVRLWRGAKGVCLSVENTGISIPDEELPRLFEAFYRVDASRSRETGGSGLGLYIVKTILDLHDARIELANTAQGVAALVWF